ncbi:hypothetical protein OPT61_g4665 [Boeremia exigua]|uniref:Uncharacterized protein n=1 Tax=Boeremia exigua TaxID=749465 RepID=A0ACC2IDA8_9PLEO|nr:hypothetical protein OPT61_g4665 [Boeremia exigua]
MQSLVRRMRRAPVGQQIQDRIHFRSGGESDVTEASVSEDGECAVDDAKENGHGHSSAVVQSSPNHDAMRNQEN